MDQFEGNARTASVHVPIGHLRLEGELAVPARPAGVVLLAHGSGSSQRSPRNQYVASAFRHRGLATLLIDLLTADEEAVDRRTGHLRFDIPLLAARIVAIVDWLRTRPETRGLPIGVFGASSGGAAALVAAAERPSRIGAVVSRGGRSDLAATALARLTTPTLLIVGELDAPALDRNRAAMSHIDGEVALEIVPGASNLFHEPGALECVADLAGDWLASHLTASRGQTAWVAVRPGA